jgi:hypothetical protein
MDLTTAVLPMQASAATMVFFHFFRAEEADPRSENQRLRTCSVISSLTGGIDNS